MKNQEFSNRKINLLPEHLVDQIKAGEVIERPASLIKELIENSIDANSTQIDIALKENGLELISVEDDGDGISFDNLPYAFCRHATSKISRFEDLYTLNSFGFRGEALASIASIARITCTSSPIEDLSLGGKIEIHGGKEIAHTPFHSSKKGTSLFIQDLFFNTPARLKFIKGQIAEKNALKRMIHSFIFANPQISFSIKWDDKEKKFYPRVVEGKIESRIQSLFFKKSHPNKELVYFEKEYEGHRIYGYYSLDSSKGNSGKQHFLFANKRFFTDKQIHQSILRTLDTFWPFGQSGHYICFIDVPPDQIDVNVHPNKTQIKFFKFSMILSMISSSLKESFTPYKASIQEQTQVSKDNIDFENHNFSFQSTYSENEADFKNKDIQSKDVSQKNKGIEGIIQLTDQFILQITNQEKRIINLNTLLKLISKFMENYIAKEYNVTPLLIGEVLQNLKIDSEQINILKLKGWEIEKLENGLLILKTVPNFLINFNNSLIIEFIIDQNIEKQQYENLRISHFTLNNISNVIDIKSAYVEMTNESLNQLFKGL